MQDFKNPNDIGCTPFWVQGYKFVKWGLRMFILGIIFGFGVLIHYLVGSEWNTTNLFLSNVTLWFGSPLSLSVAYIQLGGLGMAAIGGAYLMAARIPHDNHTHHRCGALTLCNIGLILLFITGYIGYFVIDLIWPGFYYIPFPLAKNLWLVLQGLSILVYLIGLIVAFTSICCVWKRCCYRTASGVEKCS